VRLRIGGARSVVEMAESWVAPEACTLPSDERPMRVAEFEGLFAEHLQSIERVGPLRATLSLVGPGGLATVVQDLADRETACCSFFDFTVSASPSEAGREAVRLEIRVPPARADVLAALTRRAESAQGSRNDG
jgi:hypothetical protein